MKSPNSSNFRGIHYYIDQYIIDQSIDQSNPLTVFYIPADPTPERDGLGRPTLSLWMSDQGALLQLGTQWQVDSVVLEELRQHLAEQRRCSPALVQLSPAPVVVKAVSLCLSDETEHKHILKTESSSQFPPYSAIFNVQLNATEKAQVLAALGGRERLLWVFYDIALAKTVTAEITIAGDVTPDVSALDKHTSLTDCQQQIARALAAGRLRLMRSPGVDVPADLWDKVDEMAQQKASHLLLQFINGADPKLDAANLRAIASINQTITVPLERTTDISTWFTDGNGLAHVQLLSSTISTKPAAPVSSTPSSTSSPVVKLGFEPENVAIAFIQVTQGNTQAILRSPRFAPTTSSHLNSSEPLTITTHYSDGGAPFETTLSTASGNEWILNPKDLGLVEVILDGSALQQANSRKARVHVLYHPSGNGSSDDRTLYFHDQHWFSRWYLVTRSNNLNGKLEFELKETIADGSIVKHPIKTTDQPTLTL